MWLLCLKQKRTIVQRSEKSHIPNFVIFSQKYETCVQTCHLLFLFEKSDTQKLHLFCRVVFVDPA